MIMLTTTPANEKKVTQLEALLAEMLAEVLHRGYHGTLGLEVSVQDGTIQNIRSRTERIVR
jgi:hypothetical protein